MVENGPKLYKIVKNHPKLPKWSKKSFKSGQSGINGITIYQNSSI